ncbi:hypothetical protein RP20_CCG025379 [Aedes albopictus]|nr:hypothetical protein RP20_CCG025379 [Aedes albopictus]
MQTENTEQNHADQGVIVDPECLIKHPLQSTWTLWYQEPDRTKSWENTLNGDQLFQSREFWSLYNHIKSPADDIKVGSDYSVFKKDIRPMREDDSNKRRGWWMCHDRSVRSWTNYYYYTTYPPPAPPSADLSTDEPYQIGLCREPRHMSGPSPNRIAQFGLETAPRHDASAKIPGPSELSLPVHKSIVPMR